MIKRYLLAGILTISSGLYLAAPAAAICQTVSDCQSDEAKYQGLIDQSKNQENTLRGQISNYDNQIGLAQAKVDEKQAELDQLTGSINDLSGQIGDLQSQFDTLTKTAIKRVRFSQANTQAAPLEAQVVTGDFNGSTSNYAYQQFIQYKDTQILKQLYDLKTQLSQHKIDLQAQQAQVAQVRNQLAQARATLDNQRWQKTSLLSATRNSEAVYQRLLSQAKSQMAALAAFANARVGSSSWILPARDVSDGWGSYYNQRDARWGNYFMGNSNSPIWEYGCFVTDVAMVFTFYHHNDVTPFTIGVNPNNFASYQPDYLVSPPPAPDGHYSYQGSTSTSAIAAHLPAGPVIIQISYQHFVTVRGVNSVGQLMINDPWRNSWDTDNDVMNVPLVQRYPGWGITQAWYYQ